jgi:hypothetical protein
METTNAFIKNLIGIGKEIIDNGWDGSITHLAERLFEEADLENPTDDETDDLTAALQAYRSQVR